MAEWEIDTTGTKRGGLKSDGHAFDESHRKIYLLQRKASKHGKDLGKTTGWIHRATLVNKKIEMIGGVQYEKVDDEGLHIKIKDKGKNATTFTKRGQNVSFMPQKVFFF